MKDNSVYFRDVSDKSLRRTIMSCVWMAAIAQENSACAPIASWLQNLASRCMDERKRRNKAKRYHVSQVASVRVYSDLAPGVLDRYKSPSPPIARDSLTAAFFGPSAGGRQ